MADNSIPDGLFDDQVVLVTGGTGSFGRAFIRRILERDGPRKVIVFSRDELKQFEMDQALADPRLRFFIGDVRDLQRLRRAFQGVDIVIHAAALKQVPACEYNPFEAVHTNVVGAENVINAAIDAGVTKVVAISTDKAVNPINIYGATKLCAEKLFTQGNAYSAVEGTRFASTRYGNVMGSRGSVVGLFKQQAASGVLTITDHRMTRFWITIEQAVDFVRMITLLMKGAAGTVTDKMQEFLEIALRNLERLIRLVDDLLDLSKIQSGRIAIDLVPVAVKEAAGRALEAVHGFAQEREVRIEYGASDDATLVLADADRLEQVIVNLLSNAVKFSPPGGRVALRWWADGECAVLEISDEGPGIPADQLRTIFEEFRQLERAATRMHGGAGLGLAISRTIVEHFGGDLWAESEEGHGSRFYVRLRLTEETRPSREPVSEVAAGPRHVLVVEKDPDARRLFQAQFEHEGWQVVTRSEGAEALRQAGRGFPDLITVGMELVDMHGLEFLQRLRQFPESVDIPTLLVGPGGDSAQAVAYGADGWVEGDAEALVEAAKRLAAAPRRPIVLVIEDDPAVRVALARILRHARYACLEAASGDTGLALARERPPDLVMTDWQIPGMDGPALLRAMRGDARLAKIPVIVVTGHAEPRVAKTVASLGARLITKPFDATEIIREVERLTNPERIGAEPNESAG